MPVYDYHCKDCNNKFEIIVLSSNTDLSCPSCKSSNTEKTISSSYIVTKYSHTKETPPPSDHSPCCGRAERCEKPPCSGGGQCRKEI